MKVAVFGGSGFLGLYLAKELLRRNYCVVIFDIVDTSYTHENLTFCITDILNAKLIEEQIVEGQFDYVYNLAGFANLDKAVLDPFRTMELNVLGNINILNACLKANIKRFIYASSAYAMSDKGSFYGISKLTSEKIVEEYAVKFDLKFTILRYGSVYSELDYDNNYIYNLIKNAIDTGKIEHGGDGNEMREYIHASDAAKLSVDVLKSEDFVNEHVIFTGIEKMKRSELFEVINEILGNKIEITYKNSSYNHHYRFTPYSYSPTLSKKMVANPHIDMGQGLLECIKAVYNNK
ncbi:MAG: NAD(P)-dependent oxidoreductase [Flavobacteriia bacterium]|nr:NAD(P)-dependent oxidoreductase [Flavobacteriia bacterium]